MNRTFIRDMMRTLAIVMILVSCGETVYFMGSITENSYRNSLERNNQYYYRRGKMEYYQPKEKVEQEQTYDKEGQGLL